jgi:hypothetical protein
VVRAFVVSLLLTSVLALSAGCGGEDEEATVPSPVEDDTSTNEPGSNVAGGPTVEAGAQAEALKDGPFVLNTYQPVPPEFQTAYQRKALIVVEFVKQEPDVQQEPVYPQGLEVDELVNSDLEGLRSEYPEIEFFTYDITSPGVAESSEELEPGQYGTLAAQMNVGFTPFVAMLAPRGDGYVYENLFRGYVDEGVLGQALYDLSNVDVSGNSSDIDLQLDRVELTESGGGVEYFTLTNGGDSRVDLQGFSLRVMDPETGEVSQDSGGVQITDSIRVRPGRTVSVGRVPDITDADGRNMRGTFTGGEEMDLEPGDQVALVDGGGAVVDNVSL